MSKTNKTKKKSAKGAISKKRSELSIHDERFSVLWELATEYAAKPNNIYVTPLDLLRDAVALALLQDEMNGRREDERVRITDLRSRGFRDAIASLQKDVNRRKPMLVPVAVPIVPNIPIAVVAAIEPVSKPDLAPTPTSEPTPAPVSKQKQKPKLVEVKEPKVLTQEDAKRQLGAINGAMKQNSILRVRKDAVTPESIQQAQDEARNIITDQWGLDSVPPTRAFVDPDFCFSLLILLTPLIRVIREKSLEAKAICQEMPDSREYVKRIAKIISQLQYRLNALDHVCMRVHHMLRDPMTNNRFDYRVEPQKYNKLKIEIENEIVSGDSPEYAIYRPFKSPIPSYTEFCNEKAGIGASADPNVVKMEKATARTDLITEIAEMLMRDNSGSEQKANFAELSAGIEASAMVQRYKHIFESNQMIARAAIARWKESTMAKDVNKASEARETALKLAAALGWTESVLEEEYDKFAAQTAAKQHPTRALQSAHSADGA